MRRCDLTTETTTDYEALLYALHRHKTEVSQSEKDWLKTPFKIDAAKASSVIKEHMERDERDELHDREHGVTGALQRRKTTTWDIRHAPIDLVLWLAQNGYLDVKTSKVEQDMKDAPSMWLSVLFEKHSSGQYKYRGEGVITALRITEDSR
jgi:hypothetical protein